MKHAPTPEEMNPDIADLHAERERLASEGMRQLAGDIVKAAETNEPDAIEEYLDDMLADTEKLASAEERQAAFELLAGEQRNTIRLGLIKSGEKVLKKSEKSKEQLAQTAHTASRQIDPVVQLHKEAVGGQLSRGADTRRVAQGHEATEQAVRKGFRTVTQHAELRHDWAKKQQRNARRFDEKYKEGQAHEQALDEASHVVDPSYDGEPKDISKVIDADVRKTVADKIRSVVAEAQAAGASPEEAVLGLMTQESAIVAPEAVEELKVFIDKHANFAKIHTERVSSEVKETERLLKLFIVHGREYSHVRRIEDAVDLYDKQKRLIENTVKNADGAIKRSTQISRTSDQEVQAMRKKLALARAGISE